MTAGCLALALTGCTFNDVPDRWTKHYRQSIDAGRAEVFAPRLRWARVNCA